ncbi:MAG: hypothetical protein MMC33_007060 [Icmadophila ericetorum]|nr:hypothetical protein [Icmadophila ericetorum]
MKRWLQPIVGLILLALSIKAEEVEISQKDGQQQKCNGMYSESSWGGSVKPFILTKFDNSTLPAETDSIVSFIIFEWHDEDLLGIYADPDDLQKEIICYKENVAKGYCNASQIGEFILQKNATAVARNPIITKAINLKNAEPIEYPITKTGYYCVWTFEFTASEYSAVVEFRNAYGELPGAQIPKLAFYGGLTIVYAVILAFWAFLYFQNKHDILPVQNYITFILGFLVLEQLMTWGYYDYQNRHGNNTVNKVLMVITAVLNAGRNSFSFFLLLIVCMGYGVVKHTLGTVMKYAQILAGAHFAFGVIYAVASLSITPENAGPLVLLVVMPLAATLTAFYVWTLNSLNATMKDLLDRKQTVKAMMYKKLWWCILGSIMVIFGFFFLNSFTFASRKDPDFVPNNWKTRWFVLDGWLNLVYLFDMAFVAYLWRPTPNNRRFAMSDELAQDDEGFEIASFGGSLEDEEEGRSPEEAPTRNGATNGANGKTASVPPKPVEERRSLERETIFAVGEDADKWSDDDESPRSSRERSRLTGKEID